jgi:anti-anti-sigma factor
MADDEDFSDIEPLRIEAIRHRTEVTIIVDGYLDVATCPRFRESVNEVLATRPQSMSIDASRVTFVDSAGLGALLSARHAVRTEAGLAFRSSTRRPRCCTSLRWPDSWSCWWANDAQRHGPGQAWGSLPASDPLAPCKGGERRASKTTSPAARVPAGCQGHEGSIGG